MKNMIPETIREKVSQSAAFKEFSEFKTNLQQFASTRDGIAANAASMAYGKVKHGSSFSRATEIMRKVIPDFTIFQLEKEATVLFV